MNGLRTDVVRYGGQTIKTTNVRVRTHVRVRIGLDVGRRRTDLLICRPFDLGTSFSQIYCLAVRYK
jgi:hypothetical protein